MYGCGQSAVVVSARRHVLTQTWRLHVTLSSAAQEDIPFSTLLGGGYVQVLSKRTVCNGVRTVLVVASLNTESERGLPLPTKEFSQLKPTKPIKEKINLYSKLI